MGCIPTNSQQRDSLAVCRAKKMYPLASCFYYLNTWASTPHIQANAGESSKQEWERHSEGKDQVASCRLAPKA
eukprot:1155220-Pelagomonas_calceolata.AAC.2